METKINEIVYNTELVEKVNEVIKVSKQTIKINDWQIKENANELNIVIGDLNNHYSKNKIKRLNRYSNWVIEKPNISNINRFFHYLCKNVLVSNKRVRVLPSVRECEIQESRKRWKDVQKVEQELLKKYKELKGNFYKEKKK